MKLRPHHLLCIGFFQGMGYSPAFTFHLKELIDRLQAEDPAVTLICSCDAVCVACPHCIDGLCASDAKVQRYDSAVLDCCGLREGDTLPWSMLRETALQLAVPHLAEICSDCQWYAVCSKTQYHAGIQT